MKQTKRKRLPDRALVKSLGCLTLAMSAMLAQHQACATVVDQTGYPEHRKLWCNGDNSPYTSTGFAADLAPYGTPNPDPFWDGWQKNDILWPEHKYFGLTALTAAGTYPTPVGSNSAYDRYAIQLNYWNSVTNSQPVGPDPTKPRGSPNAPFGYSPGNACMLFKDEFTSTGGPSTVGEFVITYPAGASQPRQGQIDWVNNVHKGYAWPLDFVPYVAGPQSGGPTGYVSTFKGCSWDGNSCTPGSAIPVGGPPSKTDPKYQDWNVFPKQLSDVTSIPTQWTISFDSNYGDPKPAIATPPDQPQPHIWDASYDIWFDKTARTAEGSAPWGATAGRGQNDGLEIMVWLNSNGSYVDSGVAGKLPAEGQPQLAQPTGHIRERVVINGILYDVWVGRLNNPYFGHPGDPVLPNAQAEPYTCSQFTWNGGPGGTATCGVEWNVVSFVATKDYSGNDYRNTTMSMDAKVFTDYILGIDDGLWTRSGMYDFLDDDGVPISDTTKFRPANAVLQCPKSATNQDRHADKGPCLDKSWYLMSVQAGFEPWLGGNGLRSASFSAHAVVTSTGIQTGLTNDQGNPIIHWTTPFQVIYSGCTSGTASFEIEGTDDTGTNKLYWPGVAGTPATGSTPGFWQTMNGPDPVSGQFTYIVPQLYPMHGDAVIHFQSSCATGIPDAHVFIDPSGKVFYSDGKTPVRGAAVTLLRSSSGTAGGPFAGVPDHNTGLSTPVMQPDDNTHNAMLSTSIGSYAWNVIPGWYKVSASYPGCGTVTTAANQVTATHAIENLNITLPCAAPVLPPASSIPAVKPAPPPPPPALPLPPAGITPGVTVKLTDNGTQANPRYCKNVVITNNNSYAVTWKVQFKLPYPGHIDTASGGYWNFNYTASGNTITAWGVDWDKTLAAKATSNSIGFCAYKN